MLLKQKLSKLGFPRCVYWVLNGLAQVDKVGVDKVPQWTPWYLLLFLRYSAKYSSNAISTRDDAIYSAYTYYDAYIKSREDAYLSDKNKDVTKFLLRLSHQQFIYQIGLTGLKNRVARQNIFFSSFDTLLKERFGITSREFLKLSFFLFTHFSNGRRNFKKEIFNSLKNFSNHTAINNYLELISISQEALREDSQRSINFDDHEIFDDLLFRRKPLLVINQVYFIFSTAFFHDLLGYGLYEAVKEQRETRVAFGSIFENYAQRRLLSVFPDCLTEDGIRGRLPKNEDEPSKVDAVLSTENALLLFEYKATELPESIRLNPSDENIANLQYNIIKAVAQGYKCLSLFLEKGEMFPEIDMKKQKFLFVVSYKDTYLGTADRYWKDIEPILKNIHNVQDTTGLSPKNIFFISIDDLDWLMSLKNRIEEVAFSALDRFNKNDAHHFSQILAKFVDKSFSVPELEESFENVFRECIADLGLNPDMLDTA